MAEVVILGAGTPTPTPTRFGSSYALRIGGELLMFECSARANQSVAVFDQNLPRSWDLWELEFFNFHLHLLWKDQSFRF